MSAAYEACVGAQRLAADPARSAFVAANAGAGKTRVLTDRVARLLLSGAPPARILCITYTKAAAAEMADRLFRLLGAWALADDASLAEALSKLEGAARGGEDLNRARRLFARALETPGGLKIQTIHSFCESLLKRFPIEAGAPPGFAIIDERAAKALAEAAVGETAAAGDAKLQDALLRLSQRTAPDTLRALIVAELCSRQKLEAALEAAGGWRGLRMRIAERFGVRIDVSAGEIIVETLSAIRDDDIRRAQSAMLAGEKNCRFFSRSVLAAYLASSQPAARFAFLASMLLTQKGTPRQKFPDAASKRADPWIAGFMAGLQSSFAEAFERVRAAELLADTNAFLAILEHALGVYDRLKRSRSGLDYDDLIARARSLFASADLDWVRYKLDQGLDHILLDEAQDTSPAQWDVVEGALAEFLAGAGARGGHRTFFAVGDQKQSIYSFQGADAGLFKEKHFDLGKRIGAVAPFENVSLRLSFRSAAPVLRFVDALFAETAVLEGVGDETPLRHELNRLGEAGLVELWPPAPRPDTKETRAWDAPLDQAPKTNPARRLALEVAGKVKEWLDAGEILPSRGRPIAPGDIMILVQSRSALFHEMIRALMETGAPVAGADKLRLLEDAAVEDLLSYARAALLPDDDLSLAEVLRSPLFDIDEDGLFALAYDREGSLWRALNVRADERPEWRRARDEIAAAARIGLGEGAFAFLSHILETGAPSGRTRLHARLGETSAEPLAELLRQALDYELVNPRSLQGFLAWAERNAGEVKRDMEASSGAVRVMTVHGAKGLEADIVFLLDACRYPNVKNIGPILHTSSGPIYSANAAGDSAAAAAVRAEARRRAYEEYRRLLYVAATRARDRLYICGLERGNDPDPHKKAPPEKSWRALAEDAFARLDAQTVGETSWGGAIRRIERAHETPVKAAPGPAHRAPPPPPSWLSAAAAAERPLLRLAPSRLADDVGANAQGPAFSPSRREEKFLRGRTLHRLFELIPDIQPKERPAAAERLLARLAPAISPDERARWRDEALAVLSDPAFAPVFGPTSRAEVALAGTLQGRAVAGQIDRLVVEGARVLVVDYKTNRPPPRRIEETPPAYLAQLAAYRALLQEIYHGKEITCALLWTYEARLTVIPRIMLDHAFARAFV
ncbi:MAG: double-strand break repair helicase AddA [Amphiplicatus sp.]